jgi:alkylation response protein AidB-like acyl-CoA dehydrogenase
LPGGFADRSENGPAKPRGSSMRASATRTDPATAAEDWLARARAVVPVLQANAARIDAECELPPEVKEALYDAGLFRLLMPTWLDGGELDLVTYAKVMEIVAAADASTAWCIGQNSGCTMSAAFMDRAVAFEIFGPREAASAWGAGAAGKATVVDGGYRVTGTWRFASNSRNATWLGGHCRVYENGEVWKDPDGELAERSVFFRREIASIDADSWQVMGLRGTGSDTYTVQDLFVPASHVIARDYFDTCREPGTLYKFTTTLAFGAGFAGVALGVAGSLLDALGALAQEKTPRGAVSSLRDDPTFQSLLARLHARHGAARAYLHRIVGEAWEATAAAGHADMDHRVAMRLAITYAINEATDVSIDCYRAAGATAIFDRQPFERRFRDANAISQQLQARASHFVSCGRHLLGLELDTNLSF